MSTGFQIPDWAESVLTVPGTSAPLCRHRDQLLGPCGETVARVEDGIVRSTIPLDDPSITYYSALGGARFFERSTVAYAMTTLDTPIYHGHLRDFAPKERDAVIVDVGGGDGRNVVTWLEWGFRRVVLVDPVFAALARLRDRLSAANPNWLESVLLVEADARRLPLRRDCADRVFAIESLSYLDGDFEVGVGECKRVLARAGRLLIADRDYEGGLLTMLLYFGGVEGMLQLSMGRTLIDGMGDRRVRTRCFTRNELIAAIEQSRLKVIQVSGVSGFSMVLSYLRSIDRLGDNAEARVQDIHMLLDRLARTGTFMRSHVVIAEHADRRE
jgi:SAM-dependent methyltransferase